MAVPPEGGIPGENHGDLAILVHDLPHRCFIVQPQGVDGLTYDLGNGSDGCEWESSALPNSRSKALTGAKLGNK